MRLSLFTLRTAAGICDNCRPIKSAPCRTAVKATVPMPSEFNLIREFFTPPNSRPDVRLGVGDDAALLAPAAGKDVALTIDTLAAGTHFAADAPADAVGHKCLAVSLSDLAAMGAAPAWVTLALTMPQVERAWVEAFCGGFYALARRFNVQLVGGDLSRGALSVTVQAAGLVDAGRGLRRDGARAGEEVYVSGVLGDAALGLGRGGEFRRALHWPQPRVELGLALAGVAGACIDVSDGLLADLGHVLRCSGVGAGVMRGALPLSAAYREILAETGWTAALAGGDDYELCFTAHPKRRSDVAALAAELKIPLTRIGAVTQGRGLRLLDENGDVLPVARAGYEHFS